MIRPKFSVLMSVYINEKPEYFDECMKSLLNQTVLPDEIVLVYDGPVSQGIEKLVEVYNDKYEGILKIKKNETNKGLGLALADGVPLCSYDLIARMDTDDICRADRFEKQLDYLVENPTVDVVGCHILEFDKDQSDIVAAREVPLKHDDIVKYQKKRSAFNHVTVMMKKEAVLRAGNYKNAPLMEDDMLWADMILSGAVCANIDDYLVYVRTGDGMIERRGGFSYFKKYKKGRKMILDTGFISFFDYIKTLVVQLVIALVPNSIRA